MPLSTWTLIAATILLLAAPQVRNPREGDVAAVREGAVLFRERCADCHGADAKGVRGPDLTVLWTSDAADLKAFQTIRSGVAGSIMPSSSAPDSEIWALVAYLRSVSTAPTEAVARGNGANGERLFWSTCGGCHRVHDRGGYLGPDLSRIATTHSREALRRAIREPSASFASGYEPVTLVTRDGARIRGTRKSEDVFSIQIMDTHERLQGYRKSDLREVTRDSDSLMPMFGQDRLDDAALEDLLAFLGTLRPDAPVRSRP
jgi:putative heme-binding domain-containing protein